MDERQDEAKVLPMSPPSAADQLRYTVELWDLPRNAPERVIGRASSATLARAIFAAALSEHLGRRIVLRRGLEILAESG
jgi:MoxR-like ATPase